MIERSAAVGGTEFTLYDDAGRVIATAVLIDGEPEGPFVASLRDWLDARLAQTAPGPVAPPRRPTRVLAFRS